MAADLCFISKYISIFSSSANEIATGLGTLPISEAFQTVFVSRLLKQKNFGHLERVTMATAGTIVSTSILEMSVFG